MTVILASNNSHKKREFEQILSGHSVLSPSDLGIDFDHEETEDTFLGNALGKARSLFDRLLSLPETPPGPMAVIADDSGLCVRALDGAPGVYSARYGSPDGTTELAAPERNALLLKALGDARDRRAHFVCCMVALYDHDRYAVVQETFEGEIAQAPAGTGGFGYDPVFYLPERRCTVAELPESEKNRISHRGKATAGITKLLQ